VLHCLDQRRQARIVEVQSGENEIDTALREPGKCRFERVRGDELQFVAEQLSHNRQPAWTRRNQHYYVPCHGASVLADNGSMHRGQLTAPYGAKIMNFPSCSS
jgi:hypothetical protein